MTVGPNLPNWIIHPDVTKNVISCCGLVMENIFILEVFTSSSEREMPGQVGEGLRNDSGLYIGA